MQFKPYQHIERLGSDEVEGILDSTFYIFPKIDGTNGCCYLGDDGELKCGSRRRELTLENDNGGFYQAMSKNKNIIDYLHAHPTHILYGEWLIPHTLRTYTDTAWRKFYVFDVFDTAQNRYLPYSEYIYFLETAGIDYIPATITTKSITAKNIEDMDLHDSFIELLNQNKYLLKADSGIGEGIVIKNYNYRNKYGRQTWAKIITDEFLEKRHQPKNKQSQETTIEQQITTKYLTTAFLEKEFTKLKNELGSWKSEYTPRYLSTIYNVFIHEEIWDILKDYKNPTINFRLLQKSIYSQARKFLSKGVIN